MATLPTSLALTNIADGALAVAADERNNFGAIQTATNALIAALSGGTLGQVLRATSATDIAWSNQGFAYRKTTAKTLNTSVAETDLLNGEITVGAGVMGSNGVLRFTADGDMLMNAAGPVGTPRFKLKLGGTTLLDTNTIATFLTTNASRFGWKFVCEIGNLGATNSQWSSLQGLYMTGTGASAAAAFTTGAGYQLGTLVAGGLGSVQLQGGGASAVDTTASKLLEFTVILSSSSVNHEISLKRGLVEVL